MVKAWYFILWVLGSNRNCVINEIAQLFFFLHFNLSFTDIPIYIFIIDVCFRCFSYPLPKAENNLKIQENQENL